jgi:hypothetical protein
VATGESAVHRHLKERAFLWAYERGFRCCAMEVRAPASRFRVDVAGLRLDRGQSKATVAVFECKQSREDLERDNRRQSELKSRLKTLQERRETLERLLAVHYPSLRTSDSLFPEWATFDFTAIEHAGYRQTVQKIVRTQRQLYGNTKFDLMTQYKLGNLHYLVTTPGLLLAHEVPVGWGLLEVDGANLITERCAPTRFSGIDAQTWLERIAKAATYQNVKSFRVQIATSSELLQLDDQAKQKYEDQAEYRQQGFHQGPGFEGVGEA